MAYTHRHRRLVRSGNVTAMMVVAGIVGAGSGLGAVILIKSIDYITAALARLGEFIPLPQLLPLVVIPAALLTSWWLTKTFAPEAAGHGVPQILAAITAAGGNIRWIVGPLKVIASAITIGAGGTAGREGPIAQIGAGLGSFVGRKLRLSEGDLISLVAAGAGAGIAATFNAPIAGMFFAMEVILGSFSVRHLHTVVVATVAGAVVSHSILGEGLTFVVRPHSLGHPTELLAYAALGVLTVAGGLVLLWSLDFWEEKPNLLIGWRRPLLLSFAVAIPVAVFPEIAGTGQAFISKILNGQVSIAWWLLVILAVIKPIATGATFGARGSGGIFMPSLFIGAALGSSFAHVVGSVWSISTLQPEAFALVGMAAAFTAVARAPLTAILIVFEVTGDYGLVLPLMVAVAVAMLLAPRLYPESAYTKPLTRMGIQVTRGGEIDLLDSVRVGEAMTKKNMVAHQDLTLAELQGVLDRGRHHGVPVVDDEGHLVGIVTVTDILRAGGPSDQVTVREAMTPNPVTVTPETPASEALERMAALGVGRIPVVDSGDPRHLVGMFRREDAVNAYHRARGAAARQAAEREHLRLRTRIGAHFFDFVIPANSMAVGRQVKEIPWPEGCLAVSVVREGEVLVAQGATVLQAGDRVTCFGDDRMRERLLQRLRPEEPDAKPPGGGSTSGSE
ncbi:MAG: CBS domain-containing protein [Actinobacteria bacterium]|nr:CBS domain-containing protein [Actinomycetota bacterium]